MTDRLDEIRARLGHGTLTSAYSEPIARQDITYLLAEVERLQNDVLTLLALRVREPTEKEMGLAKKAARELGLIG